MELEIGEHCGLRACKQRDFLPFTCAACNGVFCLEHRSVRAHSCAAAAAASDGVVPECPLCHQVVPKPRPDADCDDVVNRHILEGCPSTASRRKAFVCTLDGCARTELVRVECRACCEHFCLQHRHADAHRCAGKPQPRRDRGVFGFVFAALADDARRHPSAKPKPAPAKKQQQPSSSSSSSSTTAAAASAKPAFVRDTKFPRASNIGLVRMRAKAVPCVAKQRELPPDARVVFECHYGQESRVSAEYLFADARWTLGRTLDALATRGKMRNDNAKPRSAKLRVYSLRSQLELELAKTLEQHAADKTLVAGDAIYVERDAFLT